MLQIAVTSINPSKKTTSNENMRYYGAYDYSLQTKHKFSKTLPLSNFDEESTAKLLVLYAAIEKCYENPNGVVEALSAFDKDNKTDIELLSYFRTKFTIGANTYFYGLYTELATKVIYLP